MPAGTKDLIMLSFQCVCVCVGACEHSCVYRSSIAITSGGIAHSRRWERERKQCSFTQPSKISCVYLGSVSLAVVFNVFCFVLFCFFPFV